MRDFTEELKDTKFWDENAEKLFKEQGVPALDFIMQTREEIIALFAWMSENKIKSYLEIGIWTGALVNLIHRLFKLDSVAACDIGVAKIFDLPINLKTGIHYFEGNSLSPIYENWRKKLGHIDLTFIDATHVYEDVKRDFEINRKFPHRFIAFHGIVGSSHTGDGVKRFWAELEGTKIEIKKPHSEIGLDKPTMGIGIWCKKA
jgi:hypothetical protein